MEQQRALLVLLRTAEWRTELDIRANTRSECDGLPPRSYH